MIPLVWAVGDRCMAFGRPGVIEVVHEESSMQGLFTVRRSDGTSVVAAHRDLDLVTPASLKASPRRSDGPSGSRQD